MKLSTGEILLILLAVGLVAVLLWNRQMREGLSRRLATANLLQDVAYQRRSITPYHQDWDYDTPSMPARDDDMPFSSSTPKSLDWDQVTVDPGAYTGGDRRYRMYTNNTGVSRGILAGIEREGFSWTGDYGSCKPSDYFSEQFGCQPRFQGDATARAVWSYVPGPPPTLTLPGTTTPGFGVGSTVPFDVPVYGQRDHLLRLVTDQ